MTMHPTPRAAARGARLDRAQAFALAGVDDLGPLMEAAREVRDRRSGDVVTFSPKVFIPLTELCRDVCHYCTFAKTPGSLRAPYLSVDEAIEIARSGADTGCTEALFTLGDQPERRYRAAREALAAMGFGSTIDYLVHAARRVHEETGLLPHVNPGVMGRDELARLREVSVSAGIMLESTSRRLCEKGGPHYGSPDKDPQVRLATLERAGELAVPFTSGILIGIGETRRERIESLLAIRDVDQRFGHVQEVIVQNFRAKPGTPMADAPEPSLEDHLWTIAAARLVLGEGISIQAPPNLRPGALPRLLEAGVDDWGGVSPVTPDHVNPEAPWPHLAELVRATESAGKSLAPRLPIHPRYVGDLDRWVDPGLRSAVLAASDGQGLGRDSDWFAGDAENEGRDPNTPRLGNPEGTSSGQSGDAVHAPRRHAAGEGSHWARSTVGVAGHRASRSLRGVLEQVREGAPLDEAQVVRLFEARGGEANAVCDAADGLRRRRNGETVSYVVNRNINYTNVCYFKCRFCAFSKGRLSANLRGLPYDLDLEEIARRTREAWSRGATEICLQGGIHPDYTGETYLSISRAVKEAAPDVHVHAFSPLEVWQGARTLGVGLADYLEQLREAGLGSLPGTAAEILDDEVRAVICPDKISTGEWLEVMETAHRVGLGSTATIMFGHVDAYRHWARHLLRVRELAVRTGGFTEFVPLGFVHMESPMYLRGRARRGPTLREAILMHAVARLVLDPLVVNIQASWVKLGPVGVRLALAAGANDVGGTLMNETITRAAGAGFGQEMPPERLETIIRDAGRSPRQRTTRYGDVPAERISASFGAPALSEPVNRRARRFERDSSVPLVRSGVG